MNLVLPKPNCSAGFTLMELMVVVVLIGIMSAMIIPEFRGTYENAVLRSASRQLINAVNTAYSRSVSMNQTHRLRLDFVERRYVLERQSSAHGGEFIPLEGVAGAQGTLDERVMITLQHPLLAGLETQPAEPGSELLPEIPVEPLIGDTITFYPDGTAERREIELRDRDGFGLSLQINPVTSRVRVREIARK